ncbi:MAG TPA: hypothetical protein PK385_05250 [Spirochaetota bacterium]|nr:hypothetical protein [Spirochaetota bacterium]HOS32102.1 hypothetical protein [Spirochaetota bacterium]HOS55443.1 hypothetical protein [Spirochaetota bacterium]HPK60849.1 hypothetical protein [Spirochaetota bacterium]HQF77997.1 hypothetical protein [Spirochaetota bacterium]
MFDAQKITQEYERIKASKYSGLLPLQKVLKLEQEKEKYIEKFLVKIKKIDKEFNIISDEKFTLDEMIKEAIQKFGDLTFTDKSCEGDNITIDMAFNLCIISLKFRESKFKYKITVFWDL